MLSFVTVLKRKECIFWTDNEKGGGGRVGLLDLELGGVWILSVNYTTFVIFSGGHNLWFLYQGAWRSKKPYVSLTKKKVALLL